MADKVKVWYDSEGDFLEVTFAERPGYMCETASGRSTVGGIAFRQDLTKWTECDSRRPECRFCKILLILSEPYWG